MIPSEIVDKVLAVAKIEDVIKDYVSLKKAGTNFKGLCPFHNEKTGSFMVSPVKGIFKCFGCGEGGNAASFIMKKKEISFPEAVKVLAKKYNIPVPERKFTPEEIQENKIRKDIFAVNAWAMHFFEKQLAADQRAWKYISNRFSKDIIKENSIGYAPNNFSGLMNEALKSGYDFELLKLVGLAKENSRHHKFDFFIDRIMFPVMDITGNVLGFSGRRLNENSKYPKYLNTIENPVFHKSEILFGIQSAFKSIKKNNSAYITEGNTDVIRMQSCNYTNTVASLGTSFTRQHAKALSHLANNAIILMDADEAGQNAMRKIGILLLEERMTVQIVILPEREDPDSFLADAKNKEWIEANTEDYVMHFGIDACKYIANNPTLRVEAAYNIGELLSLVTDDNLRSCYIEDLVLALKKHKINKRLLEQAIRKYRISDDAEDAMELDSESLPSYLTKKDRLEYIKYTFYEGKAGKDLNQYFFGPGKKISNFIIKPIFHIKSVVNARKLFELINKYEYSVKIDIDMTEMTSLAAFRKVVEGQGNFLFEGSDIQFMKIRAKLYDNTVFCENIDNLGWQPQGFWAWANGIQTETDFIAVNADGIVQYKKKNYYIPAFSSIYIDDRTLFTEERKFKLIKPEISIQTWSELFVKVYGDNGIIAIAFWTAALFRDFILRIFKNFPLLNLFGPKGTGKSQMAMSMMCLFGEAQTTVNIHNVTKPGLADHISRFINALAWIDEYKNNMDFDKIETLKAIYDSIGRSRMNMDKGKKKETTMVNSAVIISGQEMPTTDIALFSRVLFVMFSKSEFNTKEKSNYDKLKAIERSGLSHFSNLMIQHRSYFEKEFYYNYDSILDELDKALDDNIIEDRILRNWATALASFKTISAKIPLSFSFDNLFDVCVDGMKIQNKQISRSDEIGIFWELIEGLFDQNILISGWDFKIDFCDSIKTKSREKKFSPARDILKFKFSTIAKLYSEHSRKMGVKPLPHDTLRFYLENHKYFLGVSKKERFSYVEFSKEDKENINHKQDTTAYCFFYDKLGVNLTRESEALEIPKEANNTPVPFAVDAHIEGKKDDELPF